MALSLWKYMILSFSFCSKFSIGALDIRAALLDCEKDSSKDDLKRITPPYHTIDKCIRKIRFTINVTNVGKVRFSVT